MSAAPERIWAGPDDNAKGWGLLRRGEDVFWEDPENSTPEDKSGLSEYVRADTSNALVAAAYEAAARSFEDRGSDGWAEHIMAEYAAVNAQAIRESTPADAQAALDALVAEKVREALAEAADRDKMERLMRNHRLQHTKDEDGDHYPLTDALTPGGCDIGIGYDEIHLLADALCGEILALRDQKEPKG